MQDAAPAFSFSADVLAAFLRKVYRGFDTSDGVEPAMWREVLRIINSAMVEGLADAGAPPTHEADFYAVLRHSNEVFAAFKVHGMGRLMAARLTGADGKLKPFRQWAEEVRPITSHHVGAWLRTEYDTAVIRAHNAADWRRFERDKDVMPNLRWMPTTSPAPESSHRAFWERKLTLPVDDPFWNEHHPGDRWNCKCSLEQTDDPATPELKAEFDGEGPQRGLENNTGRDGHVFSDTHPYFPDSCAKCGFYRKASLKNRLLGGFTNRRKDCYNCPYIDGCIDRAKGIEAAKLEVIKERKRLLVSDSLAVTSEFSNFDNVRTGRILKSKKTLKRLLNHCFSLDELDAAKYLWTNPDKLQYVRNSPMGEGKDMDDPATKKNIDKKKERGITSYNLYAMNFNGRTWDVKLEVHEKGFEQPYFLKEKRK